VPTVIAQKFFQPALETMVDWGKLYSQKINQKGARPTAQTGK